MQTKLTGECAGVRVLAKKNVQAGEQMGIERIRPRGRREFVRAAGPHVPEPAPVAREAEAVAARDCARDMVRFPSLDARQHVPRIARDAQDSERRESGGDEGWKVRTVDEP
jgi:hypothetical protein